MSRRPSGKCHGPGALRFLAERPCLTFMLIRKIPRLLDSDALAVTLANKVTVPNWEALLPLDRLSTPNWNGFGPKR